MSTPVVYKVLNSFDLAPVGIELEIFIVCYAWYCDEYVISCIKRFLLQLEYLFCYYSVGMTYDRCEINKVVGEDLYLLQCDFLTLF